MNLKHRKLTITALAVVALGAFSLPRPVAAVNDCQKTKGNLSVVNNGDGTTGGTIKQGGKLNGTTYAVFTSAFTPTPSPSTFSFTDELSITTDGGVLRTHNAGIFDLSAGLFSAINRIDPNTSTGEFAGATGALFISGKTTDGGATFRAGITGEICLAD